MLSKVTGPVVGEFKRHQPKGIFVGEDPWEKKGDSSLHKQEEWKNDSVRSFSQVKKGGSNLLKQSSKKTGGL